MSKFHVRYMHDIPACGYRHVSACMFVNSGGAGISTSLAHVEHSFLGISLHAIAFMPMAMGTYFHMNASGR